jgi:adenylate cyclase
MIQFTDVTDDPDVFLYYVRNATSAPDRWAFEMDTRGRLINGTHIVKVKKDYVPTGRSWYTAIRAHPRALTEAVWTAPYLWSDKSNVGMMCGGVVSDLDTGRIQGVVGVDIVVTELDGVFKGATERGGHAFVPRHDGGVFISSIPGVAFTGEDPDTGTLTLAPVSSLGDEHAGIRDAAVKFMDRNPDAGEASKVATAATAASSSHSSDRADAAASGASAVTVGISEVHGGFAVFASPIEDRARSDMWVLVVLPLAPYVRDVRTKLVQSTVIALSLLVLSVVVAVATTVAMTRPLSRATNALNRCARLDLETAPEDKKRSRITEIASLENSTLSLMAALRSFALYVPRPVVAELMQTRRSAAPVMVPAETTIFFCDIAGFTSISAKLSPMQTSRLLAQYFGLISSGLEDSGATIDKYIGDAVMAFWGAPDAIPLAEGNARALGAVLLIEQGIRRRAADIKALNAAISSKSATTRNTSAGTTTEFSSADSVAPGLRIGLHCGPVLVGNVGSRSRLNYTIIGDNVNLASRIEALAKHFNCSHLISGSVAAPGFVMRRVAAVVVMGRSEPTDVFTVLAHEKRGDPAEIERAHALARTYAAALEVWIQGDFPVAARRFEECAAAFPDDGPSIAMAGYARDNVKNPPLHWKGIIVMDSK